MKEYAQKTKQLARTIQGSGRNQKVGFVDNRYETKSTPRNENSVSQLKHNQRWCTITICGTNAKGREIRITYRRMIRQHSDVQGLIDAATKAFKSAGYTYERAENLKDGAGDDPHGTNI